MSRGMLIRLARIALILGGLTAGISHLLHIDLPSDPAQLALYGRSSEPIHLLLFVGGIVALLGWFGQYALQSSVSGVTGLVTFLLLFLGILLGDLLHCILEFSIMPVLASSVPYAVPAIADAVNQLTPFASLLKLGGLLILAGVPLTAFSILRTRVLPAWSALPFAITAGFLILGLLPRFAGSLCSQALTSVYCSMAVLGVALIRSTRNLHHQANP